MLPLLAAFTAGTALRARGPAASAASSVRALSSAAAQKYTFNNPYANAPAPSAAQLEVIRSTVPVLAEHGLTLTTQFYKRMLGKHPELKNVFNAAHQATGMQPKALAAAVYAYAANIDNLAPLLPAVARMAHKHASLSILPSQYTIVGSNLLVTLAELLTSAGFEKAKVDAVIDAWAVAYGQLANLLITEEEKLYAAAEAAPGGWRGWRNFVVQRRVVENDAGDIVSFYLKPEDNGPLPTYVPGQYTCVRVKVGEFYQPRQYTLSQPPSGNVFRISVKKEVPINGAVAPHPVPAGASASGCPFTAKQTLPNGVVSHLLHERMQEGSIVQLAPPFGDFILSDCKDGSTPVVLLSAGVGITPAASMLASALSSGRPVSFLHGTHSSKTQPMKSWLATAKKEAKDGQLKTMIWYSRPVDGDVKGSNYDETGRMLLNKETHASLLHLDNPTTQYYLCGPHQFMLDQMKALENMGVERSRIHEEMFGVGHTA